MKNYYLTKEKLEELKKELEYLKNEGRKEVAEHLKKAKEYGDLSENAEYNEAKDEQQKLETRISELEDIIRNVILIKEGVKSDVVKIGSKVTLKKDGKTYQYVIVGQNEADPSSGKISNESPLGKALLDKKNNDEVEVLAPGGKIKYKIVKIE
ncbi:MAG: transcription elongation factor GreA [Patescibacteria group bacterium]|nr:transcription elongation factor GreA [Patescibacteria group bacterium]MCX7589945.1 transcription elongation factor GreA [Patescibacteria group bacterium]MDW8279777.1 transcription elongation factor GreA [bacterium]